LERLGFPWILSSEFAFLVGYDEFLLKEISRGPLPCAEPAGTAATISPAEVCFSASNRCPSRFRLAASSKRNSL
jgi:hypothetical protein